MTELEAIQAWNNEFMRLNGIPPSRMSNNAAMMEYFKTISRNGGYKLPPPIGAAPVVKPTPPTPPASVAVALAAAREVVRLLESL
jgi:hypothetical protein